MIGNILHWGIMSTMCATMFCALIVTFALDCVESKIGKAIMLGIMSIPCAVIVGAFAIPFIRLLCITL